MIYELRFARFDRNRKRKQQLRLLSLVPVALDSSYCWVIINAFWNKKMSVLMSC